MYLAIADAEADWQDRISSGFDRLVAFASTELDKRRRSTEGVNTSPDSGLGSDAVLGPPPIVPSPDEALGPPRTPSPGSPRPASTAAAGSSSSSSVPLKYQRQADPERHHFKKKFFHRDWTGPPGQPGPGSGGGSGGGSSRFRPKGKDWDWNHQSGHHNHHHQQQHHHQWSAGDEQS